MKRGHTAGIKFAVARRGIYVTNVEVRWEHLLFSMMRSRLLLSHLQLHHHEQYKCPVQIFGIIVTGVFCQKDERMDSKYLNTAFQEYVLWLRIKYLLCRYEIVDNALLLEYEQELIAVLREENGNEFFWIEGCT